MIEHVTKTDAVVGEDGYGVYYPGDGFLSTGYTSKNEALDQIHMLKRSYPDAYVVRVKIARVK
jgi:hypothetical protein